MLIYESAAAVAASILTDTSHQCHAVTHSDVIISGNTTNSYGRKYKEKIYEENITSIKRK